MAQPLEGLYDDWKQVSGYFDADGNATYDPGKWVLFPKLSFIDNFRPQITMIQEFLISQGLKVWGNNQVSGGAWKIGLSRADSVYMMATMMRPHLHKKQEDIESIIDYLDNKITGTLFAELFNENVRKGNRTGIIRFVDIPYTRRDGQILRKIENAEQARQMGKRSKRQTHEVIQRIKRQLLSGVTTVERVEKEYYETHPAYKK